MKKRLCLVGLGLALVAGALLVTNWALSSPVTPENVKKVRQGMSVQEVQSLLGGPPASLDGNVMRWEGPDGEAFVFLDPDERVVGAEFERWKPGEGPKPQGLLARLRAWLSR